MAESRIEMLKQSGMSVKSEVLTEASGRTEAGMLNVARFTRRESRAANPGQRRSELMHELGRIDADNDGFINMEEVANYIDTKLGESAQARARTRFLKRLLIIVFVIVILAILTNAALTLAIVAYMKDLSVASDGVVIVHGTNEPAKMVSADVRVDGDALVSRSSGKAVQTSVKLTPLELDSRLPDNVLNEMHYADFTSPTGSTLHIFVQAVVRGAHRAAPPIEPQAPRNTPEMCLLSQRWNLFDSSYLNSTTGSDAAPRL